MTVEFVANRGMGVADGDFVFCSSSFSSTLRFAQLGASIWPTRVRIRGGVF